MLLVVILAPQQRKIPNFNYFDYLYAYICYFFMHLCSYRRVLTYIFYLKKKHFK